MKSEVWKMGSYGTSCSAWVMSHWQLKVCQWADMTRRRALRALQVWWLLSHRRARRGTLLLLSLSRNRRWNAVMSWTKKTPEAWNASLSSEKALAMARVCACKWSFLLGSICFAFTVSEYYYSYCEKITEHATFGVGLVPNCLFSFSFLDSKVAQDRRVRSSLNRLKLLYLTFSFDNFLFIFR